MVKKYFFYHLLPISLILLKAKLFVTPTYFNGVLERNHNLLLAFDYTNNEQSRLFQFYIPEAFHQILNISIPHAYILQRWLFVFLALCCFHIYLKKWFDDKGAMLGVTILAAVMPLTFFNHLQESAPLLMLTFLLGLWTIRENKIWWFMAVLVVGAFNNETILILPAVYVFYNFSKWKEVPQLFGRSVTLAIPAFAVFAIIRYITKDAPHLGGALHWSENIEGIWGSLLTNPLDWWTAPYLYIFFLFGPLWIYSLMKFKDKPLFLRRASLIIPIFIGIHMVTGIIPEVRQMIPLAFIVIPMGMMYMFQDEKEVVKEDVPESIKESPIATTTRRKKLELA